MILKRCISRIQILRKSLVLPQQTIFTAKQAENKQLTMFMSQLAQHKADCGDPQIWKKNKEQMYSILKKSPISGIYKGEDPDQWNNFFKLYLDFLNAEIGPRGQCSKKVRQEMKQNKQKIDVALKPYNLNHKMHIRNIFVKFKYYIPCDEYHDYQIHQQNIQKTRQSLSRIQQQDHPMYKSIKEGMLRKHGEDYNYKYQIEKLKEAYKDKLQKLQNEKKITMQNLQKNVQYQNYIRLKQVMNPYFEQWSQADKSMGQQGVLKGKHFEEKVLQNVIPYILAQQRKKAFSHFTSEKDQQLFSKENVFKMIKRAHQGVSKHEKFNRLHIFLNMKWKPKSLGEIDISIVEYDPERQQFSALVLIQCKSRLFDVRQASYQVFSENFNPVEKNELSSKYGPVSISPKVASYIVTSLPENQFILPFQSKLRQTLDRQTKNIPIQQVFQNKIKAMLEKQCKEKLGQKLSPLQWMKKNDSNRIIVLSSH